MQIKRYQIVLSDTVVDAMQFKYNHESNTALRDWLAQLGYKNIAISKDRHMLAIGNLRASGHPEQPSVVAKEGDFICLRSTGGIMVLSEALFHTIYKEV